MPREARVKSSTGIYHVMLRGINQQLIFEDEEDNLKFLQILNEYKAISGYKILAYCLMGNHIHILIKEEKERLEQIFKRIGGKYVYWYNGKYDRIGHLFQDRFKSEPVEDEKYLFTVLRYIHQNPLKAGISNTLLYKWSSYSYYIKNEPSVIVETEYILNIIDMNGFIAYHQEINDDICMDITEAKYRLTDEQAFRLIKKLSHCNTIVEFQKLDIIKRNKLLKRFKKKACRYDK